ncbi:MAG: CpaF family protein [Chloroflexi bacterium]|nr:MAG: CpaF family protein [Chloroflexota bacterium]
MVIRCGRRDTMPMIVAPPMATRAAAADPSVTPLQPIVPLLRDSSLTEIMVNGPDAVYVERDGKVLLTDRQFDDENHLLGAISALVATTGRRIDFSEPVLEARLPDGSRLTVVLPPVAVDGPMLTIRKFAASPYGIDDLIRFGSLSLEAAAFLRASVLARANLLISGGSSSGKTTLLNALATCIPEDERIVTIEEAAELRLPQGHVCRLECIQAGEKTMTLRQLVRHAVRMRPDRLIVGEVRGGEALDMLQAMNTGHDGAMSTIHANSPRDALSRMETLVLMAGLDLPVRAIRQQLRGALNLLVHVGRLADGRRKVLSIAELTGFDDQTIALQELFVSEATGGAVPGRTRLTPTGIRPQLMDKIYQRGIEVPELSRLFPKNSAAIADSGRRPTTAAQTDGGFPTRDRRQN